MSFVEVRGLTKNYGSGFALKDIGFSLEKGEVLTLMGPSGSGKSSLLRNICGLDSPDSGRILLDGEDVTRLPVPKRNIGMIFQDLALFPHMSVYNNIAYALRTRSQDESSVKTRVLELAEVLRIDHLLDRYPAEISGGERQRVALARSVIYSPALLLLDEPMSSLDMQLRSRTRSEIKTYARKADLTMIYVTHDHREGFYMADRAAVMFDGVMQEPKESIDLFLNPDSERTASFFGYNVVDLKGERIAFFPSDFRLAHDKGQISGVIASLGFEGENFKIHMKTDQQALVELWFPNQVSGKDFSIGSRIGIDILRSVRLER